MRKISMSLLLAAVLLAGCKTPPLKAPAANTNGANTTNTAPTSSSNAGSSQALSAEEAAKQALAQVGFVVYFDYDSSEIKSESQAVIAAHAKYLSSNSSLKVRLEGNTDERGSREYNVALGERRAQSVRKALLLQGVAETQITTLSYGEERPAVQGHDEAAWSKNRRVEFAY